MNRFFSKRWTARFLLFIVLFLTCMTGTAWTDYDAGVRAAEEGNTGLALAEFLSAAEQGDAEAQYRLGLMYDKGQGISRDLKEAFRWYSLAAEKGHAEAEYSLGLMFYFGQGVEQNYQEAIKWFRLAAKHGKADAAYLSGLTENACDYP